MTGQTLNLRWLPLALAFFLIAGCAKDVATTAPSSDTPSSPTQAGQDAPSTPVDPAKPAPGTPGAPMGKEGDASPSPTEGGDKTATDRNEAAGTAGEAEAPTAPFAGTYRLVLSAEQKKQLDEALQKLPADQQAGVREAGRVELVIQGGGRYAVRTMGQELPGRYTVKGNTLTLEPVTGPQGETPPGALAMVLTYDPSNRSLSGESGGNRIVFERL